MLGKLGTEIPLGFGVHRDEWDEDEGYPALERIPMRGAQHLDMALPFEVWWPRAAYWAQALKLMMIMLERRH